MGTACIDALTELNALLYLPTQMKSHLPDSRAWCELPSSSLNSLLPGQGLGSRKPHCQGVQVAAEAIVQLEADESSGRCDGAWPVLVGAGAALVAYSLEGRLVHAIPMYILGWTPRGSQELGGVYLPHTDACIGSEGAEAGRTAGILLRVGATFGGRLPPKLASGSWGACPALTLSHPLPPHPGCG